MTTDIIYPPPPPEVVHGLPAPFVPDETAAVVQLLRLVTFRGFRLTVSPDPTRVAAAIISARRDQTEAFFCLPEQFDVQTLRDRLLTAIEKVDSREALLMRAATCDPDPGGN